MKYLRFNGQHFVMARQPETAATVETWRQTCAKVQQNARAAFCVCLLRAFAVAECCMEACWRQGRRGMAWRHELSINLPATNQRDVQLMW